MKRGYNTTEAVILNTFDYSESDRIISFYTKDFGKLKGIAKGARRSKIRFVGKLDPATLVSIMFFKSDRSEFLRVDGATLIDGFTPLKTTVEKYAKACYVLELVNEMTREGLESPELFDTMRYSLEGLGRGWRSAHPKDGSDGLLRFFEIKLLKVLGYLPYLSGCVQCRAHLNGERMSFSPEKGGLICKKCAAGFFGEAIQLSPGTAMLLGAASKLPFEKLSRLKPGPVFLKEGEKVLASFIKYQLGKELKTRRFLDGFKDI